MIASNKADELREAHERLQAWTRQHNLAAVLIGAPVIAGFVVAGCVPNALASAVVALGSAVGLTLGLATIPDDFRSRNGSLKLAIGLVAAMWVAAAVVVALAV